MKRFSEQFKKQSLAISMKASERNDLRERVLSYMEYHPLPLELKQPATETQKEYITSEPFRVFKLNPLYFRSLAGVFAVVLIVGVPFIAERSMPGDVLYPVKVEFNEELRSSLSLSPYAKVAWETERLERRLAEARLLASEGKLTQEAEHKVAQAVKDHTDAAQREIAEIRENDSDDAAIAEITFASALAVQTEVLEGHLAKGQGAANGSSVATIAQVVADARNTAEAAQSDVRPSYVKLLGYVESESTHVYELFRSVQKDASVEEVEDVKRRIADIERKVAEATALKKGRTDSGEAVTSMMATMSMKAPEEGVSDSDENLASSSDLTVEEGAEATLMLEEEAVALDAPAPDLEAESVALLRSALTDIQKLLSYMTHIDVRKNVSIEELVPLTPTPEEKAAAFTELLSETVSLQETVGVRDVRAQLLEKVTAGQQELEVAITEAVQLMEAGDEEGAYVQLEKAHALAKDLDALTKNAPLKEAPVLETPQSTSTPEETLQ